MTETMETVETPPDNTPDEGTQSAPPEEPTQVPPTVEPDAPTEDNPSEGATDGDEG